ncbi:NDR1/HIN1-like protein 3 [Prosopis cineraria]|uniref:NDR1/HIN1-like protein 3 n=1 Tax=Prosopis cineraria TaxID=364024 RepID=UPI00240FDFC1|nr:NDR1/HIN1-like protein 3 [Prosopis cineraria]
MCGGERGRRGQACNILMVLVLALCLCSLFFCLFPVISLSNLEFYATEASLTQFNRTTSRDNNNNTYTNLFYNLTASISVKNPSLFTRVDLSSITASAWYKQRKLTSLRLAPLVMRHKKTNVLEPVVFQGRRVDELCLEVDDNREASAGIYEIDVGLDLRIVVRDPLSLWPDDRVRPPVVWCRLRVPLVSNNGCESVVPFDVTQCSLFGGRHFYWNRYYMYGN